MSPCWFHLFAKSGACPFRGRYGVLKADGSLPAMRWCERHRFPEDVLLPEEPARAEQLQFEIGGGL